MYGRLPGTLLSETVLLSEVAPSQRTYVRPGIFRSDKKKPGMEWNAARPASRLCVPLARSNNNSTTEFPTTDQHYEGRKPEGGVQAGGGSLHLHPRLRRRQSRGVMAAGSALGSESAPSKTRDFGSRTPTFRKLEENLDR